MKCCMNLFIVIRFSQSLDIETIGEGAGQEETGVSVVASVFFLTIRR